METELEDLKLNSTLPSVVQYCTVSTFPFEYCSFSSKPNVCDGSSHSTKAADNIEANNSEIVPDADSKQVKPMKGAKKAKIVISTVERTKRKRVTHISGLELFDIDLKKASKMFSAKFAASSSVSKTGAGQDEIIVQGDCAMELGEFLVEKFEGVKEGNIEIVEGKRK